MTFDKTKYQENRTAGKRGQGDRPNLIVGIDTTPPTSARGLGLRKRVSATKNYKPTKWKDAEEARRTKLGQLRQRIEQAAIERAGRRPLPAAKL